jgi:hypothetical protein
MVNDKWLMPFGHKYPRRHCDGVAGGNPEIVLNSDLLVNKSTSGQENNSAVFCVNQRGFAVICGK